MIEPATSTARHAIDSLQARGDCVFDSVAVIIVNFNSGEHLRTCLRAIARQMTRPRRVIVVDNGSTDDSLSEAAQEYPTAEIIPAGKNLGFAAANNLAIRLADDCRYVALVNADAFLEPDWLAELLSAAKANPRCGFFASRLISVRDPARLDGTGDIYHVSGRAWRRDWGRPMAVAGSTLPVLGACAAAALYSREALLAAGGFDEDFFCFYEDVDLSFRLRLLDWQGAYVPTAVARHVGSASTGILSDFCVYYAHRNLVWTFVKNMPGPLFWIYLPQHMMLNLATILWFVWQGRARVILHAKWHALRGVPQAWRKRRTIQSQRKAGWREIALLLAGGLPRPR